MLGEKLGSRKEILYPTSSDEKVGEKDEGEHSHRGRLTKPSGSFDFDVGVLEDSEGKGAIYYVQHFYLH
jgi:hypothetical protein